MKRYEYVEVYTGGIFSPRSMDHREVIDEYAMNGYRYVGFVPTVIDSYGKIKRFDLIFEIDE